MRTWRVSKLDQECGSCRVSIRTGDAFLEVKLATTTVRRCAACAKRMYGDDVPDTLSDDDVQAMTNVAPQPSLGFERVPTSTVSGFVSAGELARRRLANHFRQRGRSHG